MRTTIILAALLFGCADDPAGPDPKMEVPCGGSWSADGFAGESCDLGCSEKPTDLSGPACDTAVADPAGDKFHCDGTLVVSGQRGCCIDIDPNGPDATINSGIPNEPKRTRDIFFLTCH